MSYKIEFHICKDNAVCHAHGGYRSEDGSKCPTCEELGVEVEVVPEPLKVPDLSIWYVCNHGVDGRIRQECAVCLALSKTEGVEDIRKRLERRYT